MIKNRTIWFLYVLFSCFSAYAQDPTNAADSDTTQRRRASSIGIEPGTQQPADMMLSEPEPTTVASDSTDEWEFDFHGYLRGPMRLGFGTIQGGEKKGETVIHSPPITPDSDYTLWQYSGTLLGGPWAELRFSYGNSRVKANVHIASWHITDGGFRYIQAQLGIDQAFVSLDYPTVFGPRGGLKWTVGIFQNTYGAAGQYDAGKYDTYIIGRTHTAGETLTMFYDLFDDITLQLEHGVGAKLDVQPLDSVLVNPPYYFSYPGPEQQGTTLLHHVHLGVLYRKLLQITGHYLTTWTDDAVTDSERDGRITVLGADIRLTGDVYGEGYIGFSHLDAKDILRIANSLEIIHATLGGWNLRNNYFSTINDQEAMTTSTQGTGTIDTIGWQYSFSLAKVLWAPEKFWGQGPDFVATIFGMYNMVSSDEEPEDLAPGQPKIPKNKLKLGGELTYVMLNWLAASFRYDLIQPDMDDNTRSFHIISPRLIIRTEFVTHEQVIVQYSKYFNGDNTVLSGWRLPRYNTRDPEDPDKRLVNLDEDVFQVAVTMWW
ncbi:MAG: hypothetical protein JXA30_13795 [Deltaproteobacteria bacterium]|nr:hypothetical protein [Deltaproteobacteria bacterium]